MAERFAAPGPAAPFPEAERLDRLRLCRSEGVGPVTYRRLLERFPSAAEALAGLPELARRGGRAQPPAIATAEAAAAELAAARVAGIRLILLGEPDYPPLLASIADPPPVLAVRGDPAILTRPAIGLVGTRNASANGRRMAETLAAELGAAGFVIASGLARGIDTAAHRGALVSGTVAVLAGGADVVYPEENRSLYEAIAGTGAIIAESPLGVHPQARHFPRRNRLISGLSQGVIVVEAALRSGALITARTALEQGREVMAVPGSPLDPRARGPNDLIRQGAALVEGIDDVVAALNSVGAGRARTMTPGDVAALAEALNDEEAMAADPAAAGPDDLEAARRSVEAALSAAPATVDEIVRSCQLSPAVVTSVLLEWELAGRVERQPGNRVALIASA